MFRVSGRQWLNGALFFVEALLALSLFVVRVQVQVRVSA